MRHGFQRRPGRVPGGNRGFSLLEVLVAAAVLALVTALTYSIVSGIASVWKQQRARSSTFEKARVGLDVLSQRLSQATLNTYWDYNDPGKPTRYIRQSELHFMMGDASDDLGFEEDGVVTDAVFFVAPLGFTQKTEFHPLFKMLAACGFYVRFSDDPARPAFLDAGRFPDRRRFRLFQFLQPGEELAIYDDAGGTEWFAGQAGAHSYPLAENVIGLILRAKYPGPSGPDESYFYDSRTTDAASPQYNQLPPSVAVTMVVIDEESARLLAKEHGTSAPPVLPPDGTFTDPAKYTEDLAAWEERLRGLQPPVLYRIFTADVPIRGAKWSQD